MGCPRIVPRLAGRMASAGAGEGDVPVPGARRWRLRPVFEDFPAYSPDLSPIENLFSILDSELAKLAVSNPCKSVQQTVQRANRIANKVGKTDYIHNMIASMPNRLAEVIKNKGGPTRY